jgi:hypothetical protein
MAVGSAASDDKILLLPSSIHFALFRPGLVSAHSRAVLLRRAIPVFLDKKLT